MTKFKAGEEYLTNDGGTARIYATDGGPDGTTIHGACLSPAHKGWWAMSWEACGADRYGCGAFDLMLPIKTTWVLTFWSSRHGYNNWCLAMDFSSKRLAEAFLARDSSRTLISLVETEVPQ